MTTMYYRTVEGKTGTFEWDNKKYDTLEKAVDTDTVAQELFGIKRWSAGVHDLNHFTIVSFEADWDVRTTRLMWSGTKLAWIVSASKEDIDKTKGFSLKAFIMQKCKVPSGETWDFFWDLKKESLSRTNIQKIYEKLLNKTESLPRTNIQEADVKLTAAAKAQAEKSGMGDEEATTKFFKVQEGVANKDSRDIFWSFDKKNWNYLENMASEKEALLFIKNLINVGKHFKKVYKLLTV